MNTIADRLDSARQQIADFAKKYHRNADDIQLLAVSKTKPISDIEAAYQHGQLSFGENYIQEAVDKAQQLQHLPVSWHFIGPLQSNKTKHAADHFDWVHTVDRLKIARRLSEQRPQALDSLNICLQINISGEQSKSGINVSELEPLAEQVLALPQLKLRGIMVIPEATEDFNQQRRIFAQARHCLDRLQTLSPQADTLSMGMSGDLEAAIAEGATIVRLGTAIFGKRN